MDKIKGNKKGGLQYSMDLDAEGDIPLQSIKSHKRKR
jgi:hypothetical protein